MSLFVDPCIVEFLGGRIFVERSIISIETICLVELPAARSWEEAGA
jgi:hypothetical protein